MIDSAGQLSAASDAIELVCCEAELMIWHDDWMSNDEYAAMSDDDAQSLERLFQKISAELSVLDHL